MNFSAGKQYVSVSVCKENKDDYNEVFFIYWPPVGSSQERRFSKLRSSGGGNIREVVECSHSAKNQQRDLENIEETRDPRMPFIKLKEGSLRNIFISKKGK